MDQLHAIAARMEHKAEAMLEAIDRLARELEAHGGIAWIAPLRSAILTRGMGAWREVVIGLYTMAAAMPYGNERRRVAETAAAIEDLG